MTSCVADGPAATAAGFPGIIREITNETVITPKSTGMTASVRRTKKRP
jgi:hypothetical protein